MKERRPSGQITNRRRLTIMEAALSRREKQISSNERFDPVRYIELVLPKVISNFDYDYWEDHPFFVEQPDRLAFVDFTEGVQLFVRHSVIDRAYRGDNQSRFVLAHEIGHVFLHKKKALSILSRHAIRSSKQYQENPMLELEANLFAGTLLAPANGISPQMNTFEVRRKFQCSQDVATRAIDDAKFWRKQAE